MTPITPSTTDDRIALRISALRLARRRGNTREGAWAASRVRLPGVALEPADSRFARDARLRFGRALRIARSRRPGEADAEIPAQPAQIKKRSRLQRYAAAALAALIVLLSLLFITRSSTPDEQEAGGGRPQAAGAAATASPLRGRSDVVVPVVLVATPTPTVAPTEEPSATPAVTAAPVGRPGGSTGSTGTGGTGGGSGGGTGTGTGTGTASATPRPTATPAPTPTATPDPSTNTILRGRVVDAGTGKGLPNVCVAPGLITCTGQNVTFTDANGYWELALSTGQIWDIRFLKASCRQAIIRAPSQPGIHYIPDIRLSCIS
jgi:hypothetical protein